jgi:DNA-binding Lrp family transcriptional regulator
MGEENREAGAVENEVLAEWTIRRLRPLEPEGSESFPEKVKRWVLYSIGMGRLEQDIYMHLEKNMRSTTTDIATEFDISPNTARKYLDELHTVGLVDYIGREYTVTYESLSRAIELMLIPRITDTLRTIARGASTTDFASTKSSELTGGVVDLVGMVKVNQKLLDEWYRKGKKVNIKSFGPLKIDSDIDPYLLETVVEQITSFGPLRISSDAYEAIGHKIKCWGPLKFY